MTDAQRRVAGQRHQGTKWDQDIKWLVESDDIVYVELMDGTFCALDVDGEEFDSGFESIDDVLVSAGF